MNEKILENREVIKTLIVRDGKKTTGDMHRRFRGAGVYIGKRNLKETTVY